jgi:nitronate monooxygenase
VEMIRALRTARRSALKSRTQAANQLQGLRVTAPDEEDQACWRAARPLQTGTRHRRLRDTFLLRGGLLRPVRGHHRGARAGFSFTFGTLARELTDRLRENGTHVVGTATTVEEGTRLERDGVDAVVAQGAEAGGHRGTFLGDVQDSLIGTMALVPQMVDALSIPVIAAGGIMDGRGLAAALTLGAEAVQMGTAFLTCEESGAHHAFKNAVLESTEDQTAITRAFSGRAARGIENRFLVEVGAHEQEIPPFPVQNALTRDVRAAAQEQNRPEFMSLWSGQGLRLARSNTAAELIRSAITGAEAALAGAAGKTRSVAE